MAELDRKQRELFDLAFDLAFFVHAHKEIAFFVAEDALESLSSMLGYQEKNRTPPSQLRGFWKWGERSRPIRKTLALSERQMLQWLVYKNSEPWERQSEQSEGPYVPTEEDLIVRYVKHLVFTTLKRNSFYVTLAICSLLHRFDRRETRFFYDILTQSDSARIKDTGYIGKQRLELLDRVAQRFEGLIKMVKRSGDENQFETRTTTESIIQLVHESLRRFTPWQTSCVIQPNFDVTDIAGLYFSDTSDRDEDPVEMSRIHTVIDPQCLRRFCKGLSDYVRTLPENDLDRNCQFDPLDERLVVPQFRQFRTGPPRVDRFHRPDLTTEDYIRLQRMLDARGHRKKLFVAQQLSIYADDVLCASFAPLEGSARCMIGVDTSVIEVRGRDSAGEITLATLLLDHETGTEQFEDSIVHAGGQRVSIILKLLPRIDHARPSIQLEVAYKQNRASIFELGRKTWFRHFIATQPTEQRTAEVFRPQFTWAKAAALAAIFVAAAVVVWQLLTFRSLNQRVPPQNQIAAADPKEGGEIKIPGPAPELSPKQTPSVRRDYNMLPLVQASWSSDPQAALHAIPIEATRAGTRALDLSATKTNVIVSLPMYGEEGRAFSVYRLTLLAGGKQTWEQTIRAPKVSLTKYSHILSISLLADRFPRGAYELHFEGRSDKSWQHLGEITFSSTK